MDENKFEIDGDIEEDDEEFDIEEDEEEEESRRGVGTLILLIIFIIFFINAAGLFVYYQFYLGQGNWDFSMKKRTGNTLIIRQLEFERDSLIVVTDSLTNLLGTDFQASYTAEEGTEIQEEVVEEPVVSRYEVVQGETFEIQVGAFSNLDFGRYKSNMRSMDVDMVDGMSKLVIGSFRNFSDACAFRKDIRKAGFRDAFIVKKVSGNRVKFSRNCP